VKRKLVGIELEGPPLEVSCQEYWPVHADGRRVGEVTNAVYSPRLRTNIGYAWVPIELAAAGPGLEVETPVGPRRPGSRPCPSWTLTSGSAGLIGSGVRQAPAPRTALRIG
jgi:glycine cleavage system aminomethyltransferase T